MPVALEIKNVYFTISVFSNLNLMVAAVDTPGCFWTTDSTYTLACNKWRCTL